jgi:GYF domain 2
MDYRLKRGDQEFGPYSLTDLQRYLQSGHVAATDLAFSDGMDGWIPVSQVLGDIPIPVTMPAVEVGAPTVPLPPNLHWGWLLLLDAITRGYFNIIWALVQANWARKLTGKNNPMVLAAMYPAGVIAGAVAMYVGKSTFNSGLVGVGGLLILAGAICMVAAAYSIRNAMEEYYNTVENIGLSMSGVMVFFFGIVYIQYHINRLTRLKRIGELSTSPA